MAKTKRHIASSALRALRDHMESTQIEFAARVLKLAASTLRRWETKDRPAGDALLRLAALAEKNQRPDLADVFLQAFMQDVQRIAPTQAVERWVVANA